MVINQEKTEILLGANNNRSVNKYIQRFKILEAILESHGKIEDDIKKED